MRSENTTAWYVKEVGQCGKFLRKNTEIDFVLDIALLIKAKKYVFDGLLLFVCSFYITLHY